MGGDLRKVHDNLIRAIGHLGQCESLLYGDRRREVAEAKECVMEAMEELMAIMDTQPCGEDVGNE